MAPPLDGRTRVNPDLPLDARDPQALLWKRYRDVDDQRGHGTRRVLHGHHLFKDGPITIEGRTNLDTLAWHMAGWLSEFSTTTFQADRCPFSRFVASRSNKPKVSGKSMTPIAKLHTRLQSTAATMSAILRQHRHHRHHRQHD